MFVKRNPAGEIIIVSKVKEQGVSEYVPDDAEELHTFMQFSATDHQSLLKKSDLDMARVMEDLVELLIARNVIRFTDLPDAAQQKLLSRRQWRSQTKAIDLLDDEDDLGL